MYSTVSSEILYGKNNKNESTAGADASVKSLKLYDDMKQLILAYLALLGSSSSRSLYNCAKSGK